MLELIRVQLLYAWFANYLTMWILISMNVLGLWHIL